MVVHETYRDAEGGWIAPAEVKIEGDAAGRRAFKLDGGAPIEIGAIEKMSKSKRNTVDPDEIISSYGADTARWFMLSDSPPDRDVNWTEAGVQGAYHKTQRFWRLVCEIERIVGETRPDKPAAFSTAAADIRRAAHGALAKIEDDIERLRFNVAIATIYEFVNTLSSAVGAIDATPIADDLRYAFAEAGDMLVQGFAPMMPHLAEECWEALGHEALVSQSPWPAVDRSLIVATHVTLPVQINGRKRADVTVPRDADSGFVEAAALALDAVKRAMDNRPAKKVVVVPNRIVNVVV
jgi:leucyl-tRNA synthetase